MKDSFDAMKGSSGLILYVSDGNKRFRITRVQSDGEDPSKQSDQTFKQ